METKGARKGLQNPPYWEYAYETLEFWQLLCIRTMQSLQFLQNSIINTPDG